MSLVGEFWETRSKKYKLRKNEKHFLKIPDFHRQKNRDHQKFCAKKRHLIKSYSVFERANDGLSSHAFISISTFLTKIVFF